MTATVAGVLLTTGSALASEPVVGPPLEATSGLRILPDTYRIAPLRAADPAGGPPWAVATYFLAEPAQQRKRITVMCTEIGRIVAGKLGMVTVDNVFRPYQSGQGPIASCAGVNPIHGERASGDVLRVMPARIGGTCSPRGLPPVLSACDDASVRTVTAASLGRGILSAQLKYHDSRRWRPLPITPDGQLLVVSTGTFTDVTLPEIRVRATVCGPDARTDIRGWRMVRRGCTISFDIPDGPRPAPETAASRHARSADRLRVPVRVIEHPGHASLTRYTARLRLPITVRASTEGYAAEVRGPAGRRCRQQGWTNTGGDFITSYLQVAGRSYDVPILPINYRRGVWCKGSYRATVLFKQRHGVGAHAKVTRKIVGTTTFRIH